MSQFAINKNGVTNDVGAELFAAFVKGLLPTNGIINAFDNLACAKVNDNLVRLSPGLYNMSGFVTGVKPGTTADLAVDSGTSGYNRIDLVIAEFIRNGGGAGIDTSQIRILKGTSTTGSPVDPTLTQEDINGTGITRQEALYRLTITGTTLDTPELLADSFSIGQEFETTATNIKMDGTQSLGSLETVPRADHVHPTDTSRAPLASPTFSGTVVLPSSTSIGNVSSTELGYLDGVASAIQTQLNAKAPLASPALTGTPTAPTAAGSTNTTQLATMAAVHAAIDADVGVANSADVKTALNAGGTAPIYACRAWVNFNGTGTVEIRGSGNVSSITDGGTGIYTVNFTTAMSDANYGAIATCAESASAGDTTCSASPNSNASSCLIRCFDMGSSLTDAFYVSFTAFR